MHVNFIANAIQGMYFQQIKYDNFSIFTKSVKLNIFALRNFSPEYPQHWESLTKGRHI